MPHLVKNKITQRVENILSLILFYGLNPMRMRTNNQIGAVINGGTGKSYLGRIRISLVFDSGVHGNYDEVRLSF